MLLGLVFQVGLDGFLDAVLGCIWDRIRDGLSTLLLEHHGHDFWPASRYFLRQIWRDNFSKVSKKVVRNPYTICVRNPYTIFVRNLYTGDGIAGKYNQSAHRGSLSCVRNPYTNRVRIPYTVLVQSRFCEMLAGTPSGREVANL